MSWKYRKSTVNTLNLRKYPRFEITTVKDQELSGGIEPLQNGKALSKV